jgi:hypothetical protein
LELDGVALEHQENAAADSKAGRISPAAPRRFKWI